ncbi:MAG: hypothetical protein ABUT39_10225 [Acidobacteriota bacterium]
MNAVLGLADEAADLVNPVLRRVRTLGRDPRREPEIDESEEERPEKRGVLVVERTVDEDIGLEGDAPVSYRAAGWSLD